MEAIREDFSRIEKLEEELKSISKQVEDLYKKIIDS